MSGPDDLPAIRKRWSLEEEWKDRTEADPVIGWVVEVGLAPEITTTVPAFEQWEATVAEVARAAGAERWDDEEIKAVFAAADAAGPEGSFLSYDRNAYRLWLIERAATGERASEQALRRCSVPEGWTLEAEARPD